MASRKTASEDTSGNVFTYIALGSNLGDREGFLREAVANLVRHPAIEVTSASPIYETIAHTLDPTDERPSFLNGVVEVSTALKPLHLLEVCQRIEASAGRAREMRWAPRTLDLDLLLYGQEQYEEKALILPHPRLSERRFVLQPLADLVPDLYIPSPFNDTVAALLARCPDEDILTLVPITIWSEKGGS